MGEAERWAEAGVWDDLNEIITVDCVSSGVVAAEIEIEVGVGVGVEVGVGVGVGVDVAAAAETKRNGMEIKWNELN